MKMSRKPKKPAYLCFRGMVDGGGYGVVAAVPQLSFQPRFLIVPDRYENWDLVDVRIGCRLVMNVNSEAMVMDPFFVKSDERLDCIISDGVKDEEGFLKFDLNLRVGRRQEWQMPDLKLPPVQVGQSVFLRVHNPHDRKLDFRAMFAGYTLEDW